MQSTRPKATIFHYVCWKERRQRQSFLFYCGYWRTPGVALAAVIRAQIYMILKFAHCLYSFKKDTIHSILELQSGPANDPFPNNIRVLLWFGLCILAFAYRAFLEPYRDKYEEHRKLFLAKYTDTCG